MHFRADVLGKIGFPLETKGALGGIYHDFGKVAVWFLGTLPGSLGLVIGMSPFALVDLS